MSRLHPLRAYRDQTGQKLREVADHFGVRTNTVWRWENGERRPDDKYLPKMAELTGASYEELLGFSAEPAE